MNSVLRTAGPAGATAALDWEPSDPSTTRMAAFARWASERTGRDLSASYADLWQWSIDDVESFWSAVWEFGELVAPAVGPVIENRSMPGAVWYPEVRINYAQEILSRRDPDATALVVVTEDRPRQDVTWRELRREVGAFAGHLERIGVRSGDVVVGYLPNGREAVVALLACASRGAIWAMCGVDYSAAAAYSRFAQLEPTVLVATNRHTYNGKVRDRSADVSQLVADLTTLRHVVHVDGTGAGGTSWAEATAVPREPVFEALPFDHPLWVLFSSGTTGRPKGIVHGHGGVTLEYVKQAALHWDLGPDERLFWYTTPSWMMWNFCVSSLITGCSVVLYDGSPSYPGPDGLWRVAEAVQATVVGTSPAFLESCRKAAVQAVAFPGLRAVGVTGSTFPASTHSWLRSMLGDIPQIASTSGGTDIVTAFVSASPVLPVWRGELSAPCLGVDLMATDDGGQSVVDRPGELSVRQPMPSMPVFFWADPDGRRYRDAYFSATPGVWRHGDRITVTPRGSVVIHGRSDATLNRNGVRMGSADIYGPVEAMPEIREALVVGVENADGSYWMPMFITPADGVHLDDELCSRITHAIRSHASPRHVPDDIIVAPGIPKTRTGKKLEVPVKNLLLGRDENSVTDKTGVDDPDVLQWFVDFARRYRSQEADDRGEGAADGNS